MKVIKNHCAVTSVDASIKRYYIGANQILSDATNDNKESEIIQSNKWTNNIIKAAEALILYNLMKIIQIKTSDMIEGSIEIFYNSSKVVTSINEGLMNDSQKATEGLQDRAASIYEIIKIIKQIKVGVVIGHVEGHPKGVTTMKSNLGRVLIRKYNKAAKEARIKAKYFES